MTLYSIYLGFAASSLTCGEEGLPLLNSIGQKTECEIWETLATNCLLICWVQFIQMLYLTILIIIFEVAWCKRNGKYKLSAADRDQLIKNMVETIGTRELHYKKPLNIEAL